MEFTTEAVLSIIEIFLGSFVIFTAMNFIVKQAEAYINPRKINIPIIGFLFLPMIIGAPTLFLSMASLFEGFPEFVYLSGLGITIGNLTLILGFAAFFGKKFAVKERTVVKRDAFFLAMATLISIFLMVDGSLGTYDGLIMVAIFGFYTFNLHRSEKSMSINISEKLAKRKVILFSFVAFLLMYGGSALIAQGGSDLITYTDLNINFVGVIALGLSLLIPQLLVIVLADRRGKIGLSFTNLITSILITVPLIVGLVSIFYTIPINKTSISLLMPIVGGLVVFFGIIFWSNPFKTRGPKEFDIKRHEGVFLLLLYIIIAIILFN